MSCARPRERAPNFKEKKQLLGLEIVEKVPIDLKIPSNEVRFAPWLVHCFFLGRKPSSTYCPWCLRFWWWPSTCVSGASSASSASCVGLTLPPSSTSAGTEGCAFFFFFFFFVTLIVSGREIVDEEVCESVARSGCRILLRGAP